MSIKLSTKMIVMLTTLMFLAMGTAGLGIYELHQAAYRSEHVATADSLFFSKVKDIYALGLQRGQALRNVMINPEDTKGVDNFNKAVTDSTKLIDELFELSNAHGVKNDTIKTLKTMTETNIQLQQKAITLTLAGQRAEAIKMVVEEETPQWRKIKETYFPFEESIRAQLAQDASRMNQGIKTSVNVIIGLLIAFAICGSVGMFFIQRLMIKPILSSVTHVRKLAEGHVKLDPIHIDTKDELNDLGNAINRLTDQMRHLILEVQDTSQLLNTSSGTLVSIADEATRAGKHVVQTISQLEEGTDVQLRGFNESKRGMSEMVVAIQRVAESSGEASESAINAARQAQTGQASIQGATLQMDAIGASVGRTSQEIVALHKQSEQIGNIIDTIKDISAQTQLLALNASIEAARAGDAGRGFAIVATEVKKLAEQSEQATVRIDELISGLQAATQRAADSMKLGITDVDKGKQAISEVYASFQTIMRETESVAEQIQDISAAAEQMSAGAEHISSSMDEVGNVVQQSTTLAKEASTTTASQLTTIEEIAKAAHKLNHSAKDLSDSLIRFTY